MTKRLGGDETDRTRRPNETHKSYPDPGRGATRGGGGANKTATNEETAKDTSLSRWREKISLAARWSPRFQSFVIKCPRGDAGEEGKKKSGRGGGGEGWFSRPDRQKGGVRLGKTRDFN